MIKAFVKRVLPAGLQKKIQVWRFGRFTVLQWDTDGLLSPEVYLAIYDTFRAVDHHDVIEIGGAGASASIAICWAMQDARRNAKLIVIEKCEGGTRTKYGDYQTNLDRYWAAAKRNGVSDRIDLFPEYLTLENGEQVHNKVTTERLGGLMIDADGQIHRDFWLFWKRLAPKAPIVIDDYHKDLSPKHALTFVLLNQFIKWGLITQQSIVGETFFGLKGEENAFENFNLATCEEIATAVCRDWKVRFDKAGLHQQ